MHKVNQQLLKYFFLRTCRMDFFLPLLVDSSLLSSPFKKDWKLQGKKEMSVCSAACRRGHVNINKTCKLHVYWACHGYITFMVISFWIYGHIFLHLIMYCTALNSNSILVIASKSLTPGQSVITGLLITGNITSTCPVNYYAKRGSGSGPQGFLMGQA